MESKETEWNADVEVVENYYYYHNYYKALLLF